MHSTCDLKVLVVVCLLLHSISAFTVSTGGCSKLTNRSRQHLYMSPVTEGWTSLIDENDDTEESPVKKLILKEGEGETAEKGKVVSIEYVGKLGKGQQHWSVEDVQECWLKNQQGLFDILSEPFQKHPVDGKLLLNPELFNEQFVAEELGVSNKIQCKKVVMASKRLSKQLEEFPEGVEFDSSQARGKSFQFVLGQEKVIKAMDMVVSTMKIGEVAKMVCRSDFAYGPEGYRTATGEVVVPPFATLSFEITLISSGEQ